MSSHPREPIEHTCPAINSYIKSIRWVMVSTRDLKRMNEKDLLDASNSMSDELNNCIQYLEELRNSNDTLRKWGIEEAEALDALETKANKMDNIITELIDL